MHAHRSRRAVVALGAGFTALAFALTGCTGSGENGAETITFQVDNSENTVTLAQGLIDDFEKENPDIKIKLDPRAGGAEGDNMVKTRLATGDMADVFGYASGSQLQGTAPEKNLVDLKGESWMADIDPGFQKVVSAGEGIYGAPAGTVMAGGILYNKQAYEELGLAIPKTWDDFIANSEKIKAAGKVPVIETFGDTWTSQLLVLGANANVEATDPGWADKFTANEAKFAGDPLASQGFTYLAQVFDDKLMNDDFGSATVGDGLKMLAEGTGVHYPMLTSQVSELAKLYPDAADNIGVFAIPGSDAAINPLTVWYPNAVYIPKSTKHLDAAKKFVAFIASEAGCESQTNSVGVQGPYVVAGCELPADIPPFVQDMNSYLEQPDGALPALEFISPIKGPALEQILVAVGSGLTPSDEGAAQYDQDVKKQAQQLGIEGW